MVVEVRGGIAAGYRWTLLDETLVNLVERHKAYGNPQLQISSVADPEEIRQLLPRAAQGGMLEVRFSERLDYLE